jgi:Proteasome maturation factor UMP1
MMDSSPTSAIQTPHMPAMPQSNIHLDILEGCDETLDVTDFFRMSSSRYLSTCDLFTAVFQTTQLTLPWTSMRIWSESCGCDCYELCC